MKKIKKFLLGLLAMIIISTTTLLVITRPSHEERIKMKIFLGNKYLNQEKYEEAIVEFKKLIKIEPKNMELRIRLADAYIASKDYKKAISVIREALTINESNSNLYFKIIEIYDREEKTLQEFVDLINEAYKKTGDSRFKEILKYYRNRVEVQFIDKNFEKALRRIINKEEGKLYNTDFIYIRELGIIGEVVTNRITNNIPLGDYDSELSNEINGLVIGKKRGEIKSLEDVKFLFNLKKLHIKYNSIEKIDGLEGIPYLEEIDLSGNKIQDISNMNLLGELKNIGFSNNKVKDIDSIEGNIDIESLYMANNPISDIGLLLNKKNLNELEVNAEYFERFKDLEMLQDKDKLRKIIIYQSEISDKKDLRNFNELINRYLKINNIIDFDIVEFLKKFNKIGMFDDSLNVEDLLQKFEVTEEEFKEIIDVFQRLNSFEFR